MKKFNVLVGCLLILVVQNSHAGKLTVDDFEFCEKHQMLGILAMGARQSEVSLNGAKQRLTKNLTGTAKRFMLLYLDEAYKQKVYKNANSQDQMIKEFGQTTYQICVENNAYKN